MKENNLNKDWDIDTVENQNGLDKDKHKKIFKSFWMAGYECSDQMNAFGERVNLLTETGHDAIIDQDYHALTPYNIKTIREGVQWSEVEKSPFVYEWTWMDTVLKAADKFGYQIIWDLCHFGFPSDLTPLHPKFPQRFASFAQAFAKHFKRMAPGQTLIVVPFNEVSFLSWLGGDAKGTIPYSIANGWHVKYAMVNAYIQGIKLIKEIDENTRILSTEPLINVTSSEKEMHLYEKARHDSENQFQVMDILTGRICPELGGSEEYPDIIGLNYYYSNQWQLPNNQSLDWKNQLCDQYIPLHVLIRNVYNRYKKPIILSETSHFGEERVQWIEMIASECKIVLDEGIPLLGICIYPIIDRPDWDDLNHWHHSGLWDIFKNETNLKRILFTSYEEALVSAQHYINK